MNIQLKPDEEILMQVQQYWIPFIPRLFVFTAWFVIPWFFFYQLFRQGGWGVGIFALLVLSALFFGLRSWFAWFKTCFIVTNKRLVDIDQQGWFSRTTSDIFYSKIDDVSHKKKGLIQALIGYGTVTIVTTGSADNIEVNRVNNPSRLHDLINDIREADLEGEPKDPRERKLKKATRDLSDDEIEDVAKKTKVKFRKKALKDFFEEE